MAFALQQPITSMEINPIQTNNHLLQENYQRTENEEFLYNAWLRNENEKKAMAINIQKMQHQIEILQKLYAEVKECTSRPNETQNQSNENTYNENVNYTTDEEELAKETEWIRVKNRNKKRKMNTSLTPPSNRNTPEKIKTVPIKKDPLPPPIVVEGFTNYNQLYNIISKETLDFKTKVINNETVKINVNTEEQYRKVINIIDKIEGIQWHSYENKQCRPIRVIANRLHHTCATENIVEELRRRKYKITQAVNKLKWRTKQPLNMFTLTFSHDENINKIYEITDILGTKVEILPLKKSKLIPQCKRCQAYGHTQSYCYREPRCVKCAGKHTTADCQKPKNVEPKCVHCGKNHPANYRGCEVAKELQKIKLQRMKPSNLPKQPNRNKQEINNRENDSKNTQNNNKKPQPSRSKDTITYSQAVTGTSAAAETQNTNRQNITIEQTLHTILDKLNKLEERITKIEYSAKGAIPKPRNG